MASDRRLHEERVYHERAKEARLLRGWVGFRQQPYGIEEAVAEWVISRALLALRAEEDTQARIEELADKNSEGTLTMAERDEYEAYVSAIDLVSILQAKARMALARASGGCGHAY